MLGTFKRLDEAKRVIIDIETRDPLLKTKGASWAYGLGHIVGMSIKIDQESAEYYPLKHKEGENIDREQIKSYLHDIPRTAYVVGHYLQYDMGWLYHELGWLHYAGLFRDTLLTSQLRDNTYSSFSLDALCSSFGIGQKMPVGDPTKIWTLPINTVAQYCNHDVELTAKLDDHNWKENAMEACYRECQLIPILVQMKSAGVNIDQERLNEVQKHLMEKYEEALKLTPHIKNIWSGASVGTLFRRLGISYQTTAKGTPSFPQWYLETVEHPEIKALATCRKLHKLVNTFCLGIRSHIADDGCIHPDFFNGRSDDGGTVTGRFSSAHPNVQQMPHRTNEGLLLRSCFIPQKDIWYKFDYSQQEPRIMLHYASKLNLKGIDEWRIRYQNDPNADFYQPIQQMLGIERFPAKTLTLGISYNMGYEKLARMAKITEEAARNNLIAFRRAVPWMPALKEYCSERAQSVGQIRTLGNRYLHFNNSTVSDAFNHLIQGSAADQIKQAMLNIYEKTSLVPMLQVHDELAYDFTEAMVEEGIDADIERIMVEAFKMDIPVKVDASVGTNWMECR